jgi:RNA polymerase sigma-70 factor (ECF subfamily)
MTGRAEDAEDVVQETFVRAYKQLARFEARSNFATWLYRIGFNCSIDYLRARPKREAGEAHEDLDRRPIRADGPSMDDLVFAGEVGARLQQALSTLSAQERAAFLMRHYHGYSIEEICGALELKTNAAKHSIFRAVRKMRVALRPFVKMDGVKRGEGGTTMGHPTEDELIQHVRRERPRDRQRLQEHLRRVRGHCPRGDYGR